MNQKLIISIIIIIIFFINNGIVTTKSDFQLALEGVVNQLINLKFNPERQRQFNMIQTCDINSPNNPNKLFFTQPFCMHNIYSI